MGAGKQTCISLLKLRLFFITLAESKSVIENKNDFSFCSTYTSTSFFLLGLCLSLQHCLFKQPSPPAHQQFLCSSPSSFVDFILAPHLSNICSLWLANIIWLSQYQKHHCQKLPMDIDEEIFQRFVLINVVPRQLFLLTIPRKEEVGNNFLFACFVFIKTLVSFDKFSLEL